MSGDARVDAALRRTRAASDALCLELAELPEADWERVTPCAPWTARQLLAHVARAGESYLYYISRGLQGELAAPLPPDYRIQRMNEIAAQEGSKIVADFRGIVARFEHEVGDLEPRQYELRATHGHGPRPIRWFADQWLAEVTFHGMDLRQALGSPADLDRETASLLLPMLLEWNLSSMMGPGWPRGSGRFRFVLADGAPTEARQSAAWTAAASPGSLTVLRDAAGPADVTIAGDAAALALLIYGRRQLGELAQAGRLRVSGDRALADRFHQIFKGP